VGDPATAARRINFAQSFNGLGGFVAPLIGGVFIFSGIEHTPDVIAALSPQALQDYRALEARQVQLPYLSLAGLLILVALLVSVTRFPASRARASSGDNPTLAGVFTHKSFVWAIVAQFFYVGAQIGVWSYFIDFTKELTPLTPEKTAAFYLSASLLSFMVGRFIGTYLMKYIAPRKLLSLYALINIGLVGVALVASAMTAVVAIGATSFFMSIMFPTIYALGLEHLGDKAEMGSSLIIMTIISGAIIPPMMGYLSDSHSVQWAYGVPLVCYVMVWLSTRLGGLEHSERQAIEQPA
jgi:FHS family L-fucose permease-like MFS transporter